MGRQKYRNVVKASIPKIYKKIVYIKSTNKNGKRVVYPIKAGSWVIKLVNTHIQEARLTTVS